uniref:Feruloyl esterase n=1 Tax=Alexandrium catenella TaxID=2925 RepID=A0A7S1S5J9_ALECA
MQSGTWLLRLAVVPLLLGSGQGPVSVSDTVRVGDVARAYHVQYPVGALPENGWPVVFSFHGWLGDAVGQMYYDKFRLYGSASAIVIHGEGYSDPISPGWIPGDRWKSWNGAGSAGAGMNGGEDGPICKPEAVEEGGWQCYRSCRDRGVCTGSGVGADRCTWSHCEDDVAFTLAMLERVKANSRVDPSRIFATGISNGGQFVYELASDPRSAGIFAAIAPVSGLPHNGFNRGTPNKKMRFLDIGGTQDTFVWHFPNVPQDGTKSYGDCCGWYYSNWRNTTALWAAQKGLPESGLVEVRNRRGLTCQGWSPDGTAESADVGFCLYVGPHGCPQFVWKLVWDFFGLHVSADDDESGSRGPLLAGMAALALVLVCCCMRRRPRAKVAAD